MPEGKIHAAEGYKLGVQAEDFQISAKREACKQAPGGGFSKWKASKQAPGGGVFKAVQKWKQASRL